MVRSSNSETTVLQLLEPEVKDNVMFRDLSAIESNESNMQGFVR